MHTITTYNNCYSESQRTGGAGGVPEMCPADVNDKEELLNPLQTLWTVSTILNWGKDRGEEFEG